MKTIPEPTFSMRDVTVTLTGAQWFALLARIGGRSLSAQGATEYRQATESLQKQLLAQAPGYIAS